MQRQDFIYSITELRNYLLEKGYVMSKISLPEESSAGFKLLIPKYYVDLIDWYNEHDPLRKMVVSSSLEEEIKEYELTDPIADQTHSPVPGIVHRHKDRCLLMLTNSCAVHCRFCFRKNMLSTNSANYEASMQYIELHPELWEVIFSGGDPFTLTDNFLTKVLQRLRTIKHVKMIRFHTRTPVVYPKRVTQELANIIKEVQPVTIVLHINHPSEITAQFKDSVKLLKESGALLLSQAVLMKDVNNNVEVLASLFKRLVEIGIKPYYLHHLDLTAGTHHFRTSVEEGKQIIQQLRSSISGICMPEYVIDVPRGYGKIPVFWFQHINENVYQATTFEGKVIQYEDNY